MKPILQEKVSTGIPGLDHILHGGLPRGEVYLVKGGPGSGKTTLALQLLRRSAHEGRPALYLTFSQTERSLNTIAASHGWHLDDIEVRELKTMIKSAGAQSVFPSPEVELEETLAALRSIVAEIKPEVVVVDTITDLRVLSGDATQHRRELLALRHFLHEEECTTLFLDNQMHRDALEDREVQSQAHGILVLEQHTPEYGEVRRQLRVQKMRGTPFQGGYHSFRIRTGGLEVYPRIDPGRGNSHQRWAVVQSGVPALDEMLGGGLREGTACLVAGPTGAGKTTISFQYAYAAAERGERAAVFLFNERLETFYMRAEGLGMDIRSHVEAERLHVRQINTGVVSAGEFAQSVQSAVEDLGAKVVVIDSLSGYINAMLSRQSLVSQMHELLTYLSQKGVLTLLAVDQHGPLSGKTDTNPAHVSYLADSVLLLRYYEINGERHRTVSALKQRHGKHDTNARTLHLTPGGIRIGDPVESFIGLTLDPPLFATLCPQSNGDGRAEPLRPRRA